MREMRDGAVRADGAFHSQRHHVQPCRRIISLTVARPSEVTDLPTWLDALPNVDTICAHVCLKGIRCDASDTESALGALKRMRVHSCVEEPGGSANGHEGVCAYRFLIDNYNESAAWEHVYFTHGDVNKRKHHDQFRAMTKYFAQRTWPTWPRAVSDMTNDICGCAGRWADSFGPADFWWKAITWWLGSFVALADPAATATAAAWSSHAQCSHDGLCSRAGIGAYPLHNGTWSYPIGFMFALPRASAMTRSREWLVAQYRMTKKGVRVLSPGMTEAPRASRLNAPGFDYAPLPWAHVNERLPFVAFGRDFVERPVPPCVLEGDHATQNCSYNNVPREKSLTGGGRLTSSTSPTMRSKQPLARQRGQHTRGGGRASSTGTATGGACGPFEWWCGTVG